MDISQILIAIAPFIAIVTPIVLVIAFQIYYATKFSKKQVIQKMVMNILIAPTIGMFGIIFQDIVWAMPAMIILIGFEFYYALSVKP